jgi:hypothetical protein
MAYTAPTADQLQALYPAFAGVADVTVTAYIVRANRSVDQTWTEGDYTDAIMLLACHLMTLSGLGTGADAAVNASGAGIFKSIRSGQLSVDRGAGSGDGSAGAVPAEWAGSLYGQQYYWLLRKNRPGAAVTGGDAPSLVGGLPPYAWPY